MRRGDQAGLASASTLAISASAVGLTMSPTPGMASTLATRSLRVGSAAVMAAAIPSYIAGTMGYVITSVRAFDAQLPLFCAVAAACGAASEAAAAVLDENWDLLLTDIVMPGMDGIEVARLAAAKHPHLRIMFITGFAAVALAAGDRAPAGAKVLSKPVHLREIVTEVERMMAAA